ncbi:MAG: alpha/beta hydrolase [Hyphomicrobiaceae bacterium]|nr:alpha/beta hydrolase [Hyphomicrobiaceae bacterium]
MLRSLILILSLLVLAQKPVLADTMLLVPGYLGSAHSWRGTGITHGLQRWGWRDAGHLTTGRRDVIGPRRVIGGKKRFYTIDIPTEAPLVVQADLIARYSALAQRRHPKDRLILVGHSAGGVAARLAIVRNGRLKIHALLTIASPHLGSRLADYGSSVANSPLSWFAPFMGAGTINRSRTLYRDLGREGPHNILGWLNRTPHPKAVYISVIRTTDGNPADGDDISVGWRQDMNMVPALRGQAKTYYSHGAHGLRPADAALINAILSRLK